MAENFNIKALTVHLNPKMRKPKSPVPTMEKEKSVMEEEAIRLKTLAEQSYISDDLNSALKLAKKSLRLCPHLDGTSDLITAFKILRSGAAKSTVDDSPEWYKILQIEPFSHINTIKKQYKKLALTLHPDKNPFAASEEAFKLVGDAFRVLSDKIRRKEYDLKLRIALQEKEVVEIGKESADVFWTACSTCRLLHQFERKYLGHSLMCPSCKKSFKAVEFTDNVDSNKNKGVDDNVENVVGDGGGVGERMRTRKSGVGDTEGKRKVSSVGEILKRGEGERIERDEVVEEIGGLDSVVLSGDGKGSLVSGGGGSVNEGLRSKRVRKLRDLDKLDGWSSVASVVSGRKAKRAKTGDEEMMTIAEMQTLAKKKGSEKNLKLNEKEKEKEKVEETKETSDVSIGGSLETEKKSLSKKGTKSKASKGKDKEIMTGEDLDFVKSGEERLEISSRKGEKVKERKETSELTKGKNLESEKKSSSKNGTLSRAPSRNGTLSRASESGQMDILTMEELDLYDFDEDGTEIIIRKGKKVKNRKEASGLTNGGNLETGKKSSSKNGTLKRAPKSGHMEIMTVEDSDFYDFDKDRAERSFRKGQVWAIFDDDDGMPRQYALIDDVVSVNPFEVRLSWLDLQNDEDVLASWEKLGFRICCGRFKVSRKISVNLLNIFSHVVDCDRVAKELYRIYPKKGSVWALYNENAIDSEGRNSGDKDRRSYDIAVFLTSYSEAHGLSMGYLEKVDGLKSVFKRKDIGGHAIKWLEKDDIRLFSHQIPARKLSGEEASVPAKDCWELDPASLPPELLAHATAHDFGCLKTISLLDLVSTCNKVIGYCCDPYKESFVGRGLLINNKHWQLNNTLTISFCHYYNIKDVELLLVLLHKARRVQICRQNRMEFELEILDSGVWTCRDAKLQNEEIISAELVSSGTVESNTDDGYRDGGIVE
ncbi:J domain-containing protein [Heracleum sosnowskyi]|uniref:J domain-containing protein n=1 Tax=Heracleum sosnowskyi TaxID=360622 RepID=A0AAD8HD35_9APIA|nr:J domain-containing protein [Heracleum sosnowskyi]